MTFKYPWEKGKEEEKLELPKELEDKFTSVKTDVTTEVNKKIDDRFDALKPVLDFVAQAQQDRKDAAEAREAAERKKAEERTNKSDEDLAAELLTNPRAAISEATKDQTALMLQLRADNIRRDVFQDRASEFPYYSGDLKKEVDGLLAKQSLKFQNDPASIENVYHTVVGKHMVEINEGKIKSRFASSSSTQSGGPKSGENEDRKKITATPDIEKAARLSGMKTEDYIKVLEADEEFDYAG